MRATMHVGNLPKLTETTELWSFLEEKVGHVIGIRLLCGRTFCFVDLADGEDLTRALASRVPIFKGHRLTFGRARDGCVSRRVEA